MPTVQPATRIWLRSTAPYALRFIGERPHFTACVQIPRIPRVPYPVAQIASSESMTNALSLTLGMTPNRLLGLCVIKCPLRAFLSLLMGALVALAAVASGVARAEAELRVVIDNAQPRSFTRAQLQALPQVEADINLRSGAVERWRGVPVTELLKAAGLNLADSLGGGFVSRRVLAARSGDGYVAAFGLAEVDPRFGRKVPIVVWQGPDGAPLAAHRGPLMLVAPEDARGSRGVRQLQSLSVTAVP